MRCSARNPEQPGASPFGVCISSLRTVSGMMVKAVRLGRPKRASCWREEPLPRDDGVCGVWCKAARGQLGGWAGKQPFVNQIRYLSCLPLMLPLLLLFSLTLRFLWSSTRRCHNSAMRPVFHSLLRSALLVASACATAAVPNRD